MANYKLVLEYNGTNFAGSQFQPGKRTVQAELEQALNLLLGPNGSFCQNPNLISTNFAGRTDAGVHAIGQVVNFKLENQFTEDPYRILAAINANLALDVVVAKINLVAEEFHARFDAKTREYLYKIFIRRHRPVLRVDSLTWHKEPLDFERMAKHAQSYLGQHDFSRYAKMEAGDSAICNILESEMIFESSICYKYKVKANRFLRHMVRRMVGELMQVGQGLEPNDDTCKFTAGAEGLCLIKVEY